MAIKPLFTHKNPPIKVAHVLLFPNATRASRDTRQSLLGALQKLKCPIKLQAICILNRKVATLLSVSVVTALVVAIGMQWFALHAASWVFSEDAQGSGDAESFVQFIVNHKTCTACQYLTEHEDGQGTPRRSKTQATQENFTQISDNNVVINPEFHGVQLVDDLTDLVYSSFSAPPFLPPKA